MKKILFVLIFPLYSFAQFTYVPDDNFEQALINLGVDSLIDDYVGTAGIDTISYLYISNRGISDLTGIEDFISLRGLFCYSNQLTFLDLSNNSQLFEVSCGSNLLNSLDLRNGNTQGLWYFMSTNNPSLTCIDVDDVLWADYNWATDTWTTFSTNCSVSNVKENNSTVNRLLKVVDIYGRSISPKPNTPLFYIFEDGRVEKKIVIK